MSLKHIISQWNEAVILFEQGRYQESLDTFQNIDSQTSKILYNIGCLNFFLGRYDSAVTSFNSALEHDNFLSVGYFQRGIIKFYLHQYEDAEKDFLLAKKSMRGFLFIIYKQLGLPFTLYLHQVVHNLAVIHLQLGNESVSQNLYQESLRLQNLKTSQHTTKSGMQLIEIPEKYSLFHPPKSLVDNLEKKNFLGRAKVVSCVIEDDTFVGFEGRRKSQSVPGSPHLSSYQPGSRSQTPPTVSSRPAPAPPRPSPAVSRLLSSPLEPSPAPSRLPPAPSRPPPRLLPQVTSKSDSSRRKSEDFNCGRRPPPPPDRTAPHL